MKHNVYYVRDKVSGSTLGLGYAPTDGAFMRDTMSAFLRYRLLDELEYYHIAYFDDDNHSIQSIETRICSNDAYKFPETNTKSLTKDDVISLAQELQKSSAISK